MSLFEDKHLLEYVDIIACNFVSSGITWLPFVFLVSQWVQPNMSITEMCALFISQCLFFYLGITLKQTFLLFFLKICFSIQMIAMSNLGVIILEYLSLLSEWMPASTALPLIKKSL